MISQQFETDLFKQICTLREMQCRYFKTRRLEVLNKCKELEKNFDKIINIDTVDFYKDSNIYTVINLTCKMRELQKKYFSSFLDVDKKNAVDYEKRVDVAIKSIKEINEPKQLKLF